MRGDFFHNVIAHQAVHVFGSLGWLAYAEYPYRCDNVTTYFDIFAVKGNMQLACEIETTVRHALDNAIKAKAVGVELWIIVPSRTLLRRVRRKLSSNGYSIKVLLPGELEAELIRKEGTAMK